MQFKVTLPGEHMHKDKNGHELRLGDSVRIVEIPSQLIHGLPRSDQMAISAQVGKTLQVVDLGQDGLIELTFADSFGDSHFIWIDSRHLERA